MDEAERILAGAGQLFPVGEAGVEQDLRADHIGLDELGRPVDRAVDVRLRRKMNDRIGLEFGDRRANRIRHRRCRADRR